MSKRTIKLSWKSLGPVFHVKIIKMFKKSWHSWRTVALMVKSWIPMMHMHSYSVGRCLCQSLFVLFSCPHRTHPSSWSMDFEIYHWPDNIGRCSVIEIQGIYFYFYFLFFRKSFFFRLTVFRQIKKKTPILIRKTWLNM